MMSLDGLMPYEIYGALFFLGGIFMYLATLSIFGVCLKKKKRNNWLLNFLIGVGNAIFRK
jgi:hypothetical protein